MYQEGTTTGLQALFKRLMHAHVCNEIIAFEKAQ